MKGRWSTAAAFGAIMLSSGCISMQEISQREEARQLAWTGPGAGPCLFGGATPRAAEHCAQVNFGVEGVLQAVNERVRSGLGSDADCKQHVAEVRRALARRTDLRTEPVYSCPIGGRARGECHVSLAVTTADGKRYVVDNGSAVGDTVGAGGVAEFAAYANGVEHVYWVGTPPTVQDVAARIPGFVPSTVIASSH